MSALFVFVGELVWLVGSEVIRDVGVNRPSSANEPDASYSWQIPLG